MALTIGGLARKLIDQGLIDEDQASKALALSVEKNCGFVTQLLARSQLDGEIIARTAAQEFHCPLLDLSAFDQSSIQIDLIDIKLVKKHQILPLLKHDNRLFLAVTSPSELVAINEIKFHTGLQVETVVVEASQLNSTIASLSSYPAKSPNPKSPNDPNLEKLELNFEVMQEKEVEEDLDAAESAPIVKAVNKILLDAVHSNASDIHLEPYEKAYRIRFRIDGVLNQVACPPISVASRITARLKIMSRMNVSERRVPQDGRIKLNLDKRRTIDFRINTLPTLWGEKVVLRVLDPSQSHIGIERLGMEESQRDLFLNALNRPQGMILVTGPTGSGKTVSLYTGLSLLNTEERNLSTVEDPVEIDLEGINQVQVDARLDLDFACVLRALLRQDPDVVMVGEIRDLETAQIATKAAQTGHLVLSTLHTNSAPEAITRLLDMGIPPYVLANSISLIVAQRLLRKLCEHCKEKARITENVYKKECITDITCLKVSLYRAVGCKYCKNGYQGRVGIYEVVPINEAVSRIIIASGNPIEVAERMKCGGVNSLRQSALVKVAQGITSLEEANRLT